MTRTDEILVGEIVLVTDLRQGTTREATVLRIESASQDPSRDRIVCRYVDETYAFRVGPGFITLIEGEES
jgi:hypothetical protein